MGTALQPGKRYLRKCSGGPFDGQELALRTGTTCNLVVNGWRGRYVIVGNNVQVMGDARTGNPKAQLVWRPHDAR